MPSVACDEQEGGGDDDLLNARTDVVEEDDDDDDDDDESNGAIIAPVDIEISGQSSPFSSPSRGTGRLLEDDDPASGPVPAPVSVLHPNLPACVNFPLMHWEMVARLIPVSRSASL